MDERKLHHLASHGDERAQEALDRITMERQKKVDADMGAAMFAALRRPQP